MKPTRIPVTLRLPVALKRRLERLARAERRSINNYITTALQTAVDCMDVAEAFNAAGHRAMVERGLISEHEDIGGVSRCMHGEEPDF
jgi:predicted transcriptional regulator